MMGLSGSHMSHLDGFGTACEESDGNTAINCSTGENGSDSSKDWQSLANRSMFRKSEANGA
jgi:hypothetical protein